MTASCEPGRARAARLREQARALELEARRLEGEDLVTFGQAAEAWLAHRRDVKRVRPSTLQNHTYDLRSRILPRWADIPLVAIEPADIVEWRDKTAAGRTLKKDARPLNPRTVNKTMIVFGAVLRFACRPESLGGFGLPSNPAAFVEKLRENDRAPVDYFEPDEIVSIAAALRAGRHRTDRMPAGGEHALAVHRSARALEDLRDAAVMLTASFAGLRRGELVGLQWADVDFANERLLVRRSYVLGEMTRPRATRSARSRSSASSSSCSMGSSGRAMTHARLAGVAGVGVRGGLRLREPARLADGRERLPAALQARPRRPRPSAALPALAAPQLRLDGARRFQRRRRTRDGGPQGLPNGAGLRAREVARRRRGSLGRPLHLRPVLARARRSGFTGRVGSARRLRHPVARR